MYKSFSLKNFRGFEELELKSLRRVNLVTGQNNVGKTAVLEALFLHCGAFNPELAATINGLRGVTTALIDVDREFESPWDSIFHNFRSTKPVILDAAVDQQGWTVRLSHVTDQAEISGLSFAVQKTYDRAVAQSTRVAAKILKLEFRWHKKPSRNYFLIVDASGKKVEPPPPAPIIPCRFQYATTRVNAKEEAGRFVRVQLDGSEDFIRQALATLEPRLKKLTIAVEASEPMIHGDIGIEGRKVIPLALMGDGINRLASVLLLIASAPKGVVLIDEIDTGWHHSILEKVWRQIFLALELYDVQLFCTTHSLECVSAAHAAAVTMERYPFKLIRLERNRDSIVPVEYDQETLATSLKNDFEMR